MEGNNSLIAVKKKIIILLLFIYPLGVYKLVKSDLFKHKRTVGLFMLSLHTLIAIPFYSMLIFVFCNNDHVIDIAIFSIFFAIFTLPVTIAFFIDDIVKKKKEQEVISKPPLTSNTRVYYGQSKVDFETNVPLKEKTSQVTCNINTINEPLTNANVNSYVHENNFKDNNELNYNNKETSYLKQNILTDHELDFYRVLQPVAENYRLNVLSKVRVADLIRVDSNLPNSEWWSNFGKIKSKHIDFALARKSDLSVILVIELDDNSHSRYDRIKRDEFIDLIFKDVGIPLIHVYNAFGIEEKIKQYLR